MDDITLRTDVEVLKRDMHQLNGLFSRLDITIEKLGEVSSNISKIIAVHEQKLERQEETDKQLHSLVEVLFNKLEDRRKDVEDTKQEVRKELANLHSDIMNEMKEMQKSQKEYHLKLHERVTAIEKWKWMILGGAILAGYLFSIIQKFI